MINSDPKNIFDYIFSLTTPGVKLELSRVERLMTLLGEPHRSYKIIHIAGTNGKGSTAAMLASILNVYGIKTGLFTSPHLIKPNERVRIGQKMIPDEFIVDQVEAWRSDIDKLGITFFEVLTALGMVYFKEQQVEYAVFETGLGGRLDATNVVDPVVSIITAISMDHEHILGHTLEKIALEKAGIIKPGRPLILGRNEDRVQQLMEAVCQKRGSVLIPVDELVRVRETWPEGTGQKVTVELNGRTIHVNLPLMGGHQLENFNNVLVTLDYLNLDLDSLKIQAGLDSMQWLGRMQVLHKEPLVLYDVAHNLDGLERLMEALREQHMQDAVLIAAFNARKNISVLLDALKNWSGPVLFTAFQGHSALDVAALKQYGIQPELIFSDPQEAYARALELQLRQDQCICFFGSHYLAEELFGQFVPGS